MDIDRRRTEVLLGKLSELSEDDFTMLVVKPLFEAMGYRKVDFNGGVYERGKDLIAYKDNPPSPQPLITVIQSKKIGNAQKVGDSAKMRMLVGQLQQCYTDKVIIDSGNKIRPSQIFLCCPEPISHRFLEDLNGALYLDGKEVYPLDGPTIIKMIAQYDSKIYDAFVGTETNFVTPEAVSVNNQELFNALNEKAKFKYDECYSNLNFFVGHVASSLFLRTDVDISSDKLALDYERFSFIRDISIKIEDNLSIGLISESVDDLEEAYAARSKAYLSDENTRNQEASYTCESELISLIDRYNGRVSEIKALYNQTVEREKSVSIKEKIRTSSMADNVKKIGKISLESLLGDQSIESVIYVSTLGVSSSSNYSNINSLFQDCFSISNEIKGSISEFVSLRMAYIPPPKVEFTFNGDALECWWEEASEKYKNSLVDLNSGGFSASELLRFLDYVDSILKVAGYLRDVSIKEPDFVKFKANLETNMDRLMIPPHCVFDSGKDIALYGGAGVGKTTTLQNYAKDYNYDHGVLIYLPLNRLIHSYLSSRRDVGEEIDSKGLYNNILLLILASKNMDLSVANVESLQRILSDFSGFKIILDGLDEAYSQVNDLFLYIDDFKRRFPKSQLIVSSRDCVSYVKNISFLGVTLLPFTTEQLGKFIAGWVGDEIKAVDIMRVVKERDLYGIINKPLNATIFCSLVSKGIDIPNCESDIYQKRISLLCGDYDGSKGVVRQSFDRETLELAARKIAYAMHVAGVRYISFEKSIEFLEGAKGISYSRDTYVDIVSELEETCNVLIRDPITSKLSFGHFRFQEHLASVEISRNRNIDILDLLSRDWWRGAMVLYAQVNDIEYILDGLSQAVGININSRLDTLNEMISTKSSAERKTYNRILSNIIKMLDDDQNMLDIDTDYYEYEYEHGYGYVGN